MLIHQGIYMIEALAAKFGFVRKADVIKKLQFARSIGKRLDEHREVVDAIEAKTRLFNKDEGFWHASHMAMQDDYLMRLYHMVHGCWPDDSIRHQRNGEVVRARPLVLGECNLPEYKEVEQGKHPVMEPFPITEPYKFQEMRGDIISDKIATSGNVCEFLGACNIVQGSQEWEAAFAGVPIRVDDTTMRFIRR
jgi:hypothetical protein